GARRSDGATGRQSDGAMKGRREAAVADSENERRMPKLLQREEVASAMQRHRAVGGRIIFTNGCFDLLHVGHVRYLQEARSLGDFLILGLNGDESTRQLKGQGRPLVPEMERAEILAALTCIDYVTIFSEPTANALVCLLQPAIYVKGGDYAGVQSN